MNPITFHPLPVAGSNLPSSFSLNTPHDIDALHPGVEKKWEMTTTELVQRHITVRAKTAAEAVRKANAIAEKRYGQRHVKESVACLKVQVLRNLARSFKGIKTAYNNNPSFSWFKEPESDSIYRGSSSSFVQDPLFTEKDL